MTALSPVTASRELVEIWRTDDCAAYESVYLDQNGVVCSELVIWDRNGGRYREVIGGVDLTTIRRDWKAASPQFNSMQVPDDAGRKVWTHLEPKPEPKPVVEPELKPEPVPEPAFAPAVSPDVERTARVLAIQVRQSSVKLKSDFFPQGIPTVGAEAWISYALGQKWITEDGDGRLMAGPVSPYLPEPTAD
jgi:hypothetical protein